MSDVYIAADSLADAQNANNVNEQKNAAYHRRLPPNYQKYDEVHVFTVPRYKSSQASGSEWRISANVQFKRKGIVLKEEHCYDVATAMNYVQNWYREINTTLDSVDLSDFCDQEGCTEKATVTYLVKHERCERCGQHDAYQEEQMVRRPHILRFCAKHSIRGDCGIQDADDNYQLLEGTVQQPPIEDISIPSTIIIDQ